MLRRALKGSGLPGQSSQRSDKITSAKKNRKRANIDAEKVLQDIVFGEDEDLIQHLTDEKSITHPKNKLSRRQRIVEANTARKPAWEDKDDESSITLREGTKSSLLKPGESITGKAYTKRLQGQFEKALSTPSWAQLGSEKNKSDDDNDSDLLQSTGDYLVKSSVLPNGILNIKKCTNANKECPPKCRLNSVEFHPTAQVILAAGSDPTLSFFQVDGKENPKIQGVFFKDYPIQQAHFCNQGTEVVVSSMKKQFYYYDMLAGRIVSVPKIKGLEDDILATFVVSPDGRYLVFLGRFGRIHLISVKSKEWIDTLKMNGKVTSVAFSKDGSRMYSFGDECYVYVWDMETRDCIHKFYDDGCFSGTTVAVSPNNQYLCCGSQSGIVNFYDLSTCLAGEHPKPHRSIGNLTTPVTQTLFNASSEILALTADDLDAVKLVHLPSCTVFSNFPELNDNKLRAPKCIDFSLNSGYMAIANTHGHALLYRLKHYENY